MTVPIEDVRPLANGDWKHGSVCTGRIDSNEVHLWRIRLTDDSPIDNSVLSADEVQRASRFKNAGDRRCFAIRRRALRLLLSTYLVSEPREIEFRQNAYGKPTAEVAGEKSRLSFSSSSRDHVILIALGHDALGVDVENTAKEIEIDSIATRFFHPREAVDILGFDGQERAARFFACWTRKEAYVKAIGRGLDVPLDLFRVSVTRERAELLWRDESIGDSNDWLLRSLEPYTGYLGALAINGTTSKIRCFDFE